MTKNILSSLFPIIARICALLLFVSATIPLRADDKPVSENKLPPAAKTFIKENFAKQKIVRVTYDKDWRSSTYDVKLDDGTEMEFTSKGEWIEIEAGKDKNVPTEIVHPKIVAYIKEKYPSKGGVEIKEISRKSYGYKVELRGETELRFDRNGEFKGVDD